MTGQKKIVTFIPFEPNDEVIKLINFIEENLPLFTNSKEFKAFLEKKKNETQHSSAFCTFMTTKCGARFYFGNEQNQKGTSKIDIGVIFLGELLFTIEAKILPTPIGTKKNPRSETEYVFGKGAGIQRFKEGKHGLDHVDNSLSINGMIAYVKEEDFEHWHAKINQWIIKANWSDLELLHKDYFNETAKLTSSHIRNDKSMLLLHHFWVKVN
jgi:hypothetical protein